VAVGVNSDHRGRLSAVSANEEAAGFELLARPARTGEWWDYVVGVAAPLVERAGAAHVSLDVAVASDVPTGAGLSSSAALEVATALAVARALDGTIDPRDAAMTAWRAETGFVGVNCGIMDQFASALARERHALHLDCETTRTEDAPFADAVLIIDSGVRRSLRHSEFNTRQRECAEALALLQRRWPELRSLAKAEPGQLAEARLPAPLDRRALHVVLETRRVREAVALLAEGRPLTRELLVGSHESLRDLYECSHPNLDWLVARALVEPGVRGARLTGAGWGGCIIVVGDAAELERAGPAIARDYEHEQGLRPRLWLSAAAAGARIES
jgi:galactokinase